VAGPESFVLYQLHMALGIPNAMPPMNPVQRKKLPGSGTRQCHGKPAFVARAYAPPQKRSQYASIHKNQIHDGNQSVAIVLFVVPLEKEEQRRSFLDKALK